MRSILKSKQARDRITAYSLGSGTEELWKSSGFCSSLDGRLRLLRGKHFVTRPIVGSYSESSWQMVQL